jgi:hypothetical protein
VRDEIVADQSPVATSALAAGLHSIVALPILGSDGLKAVIAWYL